MKNPLEIYWAHPQDLIYPPTPNTLGVGVHGAVTKAQLEIDAKFIDVAIKKLSGSTADFYDNSSSTWHEIKLMNCFSSHPHIVQLLGVVDLPNNMIGVLMPVYPNRSLATFIKQLSPLQLPILLSHRLNMMVGIAAGLRTIHESGYIHRDMKLDNILLDNNFMPVISDLGEARRLNADGTYRSHRLAGTIATLPPEIINQKLKRTNTAFEYSKSGDIFGLALIYWSLYTQLNFRNDLDFTKNEWEAKIAEEGSMPTFWPHIPHTIADLLKRMLSHNPHERPNLQALSRVLEETKSSLLRGTTPSYELTEQMPNVGNDLLFISMDSNRIDSTAVFAIKVSPIISRPYEHNATHEMGYSIPKHPGLIEMHDKIYSDGYFLSVMEYAPNGTLRTRINSIETLPNQKAHTMIRGIVAAIHHLHIVGYLHRNLRLENIVFDRNDNPKLCDYKYTVLHNRHGGYEGDESHHDLYFASPEIAATGISASDSGQPYQHPYRMHYSKQAEIFTLGLIIWAIYARTDKRDDIPVPVASADETTLHQLTAIYIASGAVPKLPFKMPRATKAIVSSMLAFNPSIRPKIHEVAQTFKDASDQNRIQTRRSTRLQQF